MGLGGSGEEDGAAEEETDASGDWEGDWLA